MKNTFVIKRLAIIGLGLMGGSLGMAVKKRHVAKTVVGFARRGETRDAALKLGVVDEVFDNLDLAVKDADFVVFCAPIRVIISLIKKSIPSLAENCVVTDVGSSKNEIVTTLDPFFKKSGAFFVGSHPFAGCEKQGVEAARGELYENAVVVLTPSKNSDKRALDRVSSFWSSLNARVAVVSPKEHDDLAARTSHLPHLVAAMLAHCVGRKDSSRIRSFCGTGFFDATRIADGDPALWRDIVQSNSSAIARELKTFEREVGRMRTIVEKGDHGALRRFLESAKVTRRALRGAKPL